MWCMIVPEYHPEALRYVGGGGAGGVSPLFSAVLNNSSTKRKQNIPQSKKT